MTISVAPKGVVGYDNTGFAGFAEWWQTGAWTLLRMLLEVSVDWANSVFLCFVAKCQVCLGGKGKSPVLVERDGGRSVYMFRVHFLLLFFAKVKKKNQTLFTKYMSKT